MATIHGKGTVFTLATVDLSVYSNTVEFERTSDKHDTTVFGMNSHRYQGGLGDGTATIKGFYDDAAAGPRATVEPLVGTLAALVFKVEGTGAGRPQDTVQVLVEKYKESSEVADMVMFEIELQMAGDVTTVDQ